MGEAPGHFLQWFDEVQSPYGERPCNGDGLQSMSRKVRVTGVELATFAGAHDLGFIGDCRGPVKALPERIAHEGARCRVVTTDSGVDVPE